MEVKPGYKQTEVGVIPEDWDVEPLGDIATLRTGIASTTRVRYSATAFRIIAGTTTSMTASTSLINHATGHRQSAASIARIACRASS